jgi:transcriptional regulator with XRE-family HTH domain
MELGTELKAARRRAKLSLRDVERRAGISNGYLSLIESGQVKQPAPRFLHALAGVYGVSYGLLMELAGHVAPSPAPELTAESTALLDDLSEAEWEQVRAFARFLRASRSSESVNDEL